MPHSNADTREYIENRILVQRIIIIGIVVIAIIVSAYLVLRIIKKKKKIAGVKNQEENKKNRGI